MLAPGLALVALGGSVPSYLVKPDGEKSSIYSPYPYASDATFKSDLEELLSEVSAKQIILMTHDGP